MVKVTQRIGRRFCCHSLCVATITLFTTALIVVIVSQRIFIENQTPFCFVTAKVRLSAGDVCECFAGDVIGHVSRKGIVLDEIKNDNGTFRDSRSRRNDQQQVVPEPRQYILNVIVQLGDTIEHLKMIYGLSRVALLDVGCDDMTWMIQFLDKRDDIDYTGIDIDKNRIARYRKSYGVERLTWKFHAVDIVREDGIGKRSTIHGMPGGHFRYYDLVFARRSLLQGLPLSDAVDVLRCLSALRSGEARRRPVYLLAPTSIETFENFDPRGEERKPLNLLIPPVSLAPPLCLRRDPVAADNVLIGYTGIWSLPLTQVTDCKNVTTSDVVVSDIGIKLYSCVTWLKRSRLLGASKHLI